MTDWHTDELAEKGVHIGCPVRHEVSRLVVDPERFRDDKDEPMSVRGMGAVYTHASDGALLRHLSAQRRELLLKTYYDPYHDRFNRLARELVERCGQCLVADIHSFPSVPLQYEPDQGMDRPDICVGTDDFHTPGALVQAVEDYFSRRDIRTAQNRPYAGTFVPNEFYGKNKRLASIMIEINRALYMDETTGEKKQFFNRTKTLVDGVFNVFKDWLLTD